MLISYDSKHDDYKVVRVVQAAADGNADTFLTEALGRRLAAVVPGKKGTTEIWLMKEYGVKQPWMRMLRFQPPISEPCRDLRPLAYSKSGDEVLLSYDRMCLNWYHLKKKTVRIAYGDGVSASFGAAPSDPNFDAEFCVGSLVSPYSPNEKEVQKSNFIRKQINKKRA